MDGEAPYRCVPDLLAGWAERAPDAPAILAPGRAPLTYGALGRHADETGRTLRRLGVGDQDRIALIVPNGPELATAVLEVAAHAIAAPLNPDLPGGDLALALEGLRATAVVFPAGQGGQARAVAEARGLAVLDLVALTDEPAGLFALDGQPRSRRAPDRRVGPDDVAVLLHTSGTTARPKRVPITHDQLCRDAHAAGTALALTPADRCLNVAAVFHSHGLGALTRCLMAGSSIACLSRFSTRAFFDAMAAYRPTWYTAVPTIHHAILADAGAYADTIGRARLRFVRSASMACAPSLVRALEETFRAPVIEGYGMAETASQIALNPLPPGVRKLGSVGLPTALELQIVDETGAPVPTGTSGEIVLRGPGVVRGYDDDPEADRQAFVGGWFRTGDQGYLDADGYLFITGRLKELINRGGSKIAPREVDEVLLEHPAVAQAIAFAVPHPRLGEDVAAAVVLRPGTTATAPEIRRYAATRLADFKVPRRVLVVDALPTGPTGKLQRRGLARWFDVAAPVTEYVAPRTEVEAVLAEIWARVLDVARVGIHDDFFHLGGDSLQAARVIARTHEIFGTPLPPASLFEAPTVARLARLVDGARETAPAPLTAGSDEREDVAF
jgi:oxalate---CoA ligase